jgi:hypothetical protein
LGFTDPPGFQAMGQGYTPNLYITGVYMYDGKGHVTAQEHGILIIPGPYFQGSGTVITFEENCDLTYVMNGGRSFTQEGSCTSTDGLVKVTGVKVVGQIGAGGSVLILSQFLPPVVETLEFFDTTGTLVGSTKRICGGVGTAVRIQPQ